MERKTEKLKFFCFKLGKKGTNCMMVDFHQENGYVYV